MLDQTENPMMLVKSLIRCRTVLIPWLLRTMYYAGGGLIKLKTRENKSWCPCTRFLTCWKKLIAKLVMIDMIQRKFYWPGFFKSVEEFCRSCEVCAKNKTVPRPRSPMKPIEVVPISFYMIGVDLVGPIKTTSQRNKCILSVIDYYTKYAEAIALPNQ